MENLMELFMETRNTHLLRRALKSATPYASKGLRYLIYFEKLF